MKNKSSLIDIVLLLIVIIASMTFGWMLREEEKISYAKYSFSSPENLSSITLIQKDLNLISININEKLSVFKVADTNSMLPTFDYTARIIVKETNNVSIGDIAIYIRNNKYRIHRVISEENGQLILKGDNNPYLDKPINKEQVKYKVIGIIY